jgi:nitrite reductase/ring-hydroxylating ferredoxin subunit
MGALRWLWRMGLAVPLIIGAALVAFVLITLASPRYHAPDMITVGSYLRYEAGAPVYSEEHDFWFVRLPEDRVVALHAVDPTSGCSIMWRPGHEHMGRSGWFVDPCRASVYDLQGNCFSGPCERGLDRRPVTLQVTEVVISVTEVERGRPPNPAADPITPP